MDLGTMNLFGTVGNNGAGSSTIAAALAVALAPTAEDVREGGTVRNVCVVDCSGGDGVRKALAFDEPGGAELLHEVGKNLWFTGACPRHKEGYVLAGDVPEILKKMELFLKDYKYESDEVKVSTLLSTFAERVREETVFDQHELLADIFSTCIRRGIDHVVVDFGPVDDMVQLLSAGGHRARDVNAFIRSGSLIGVTLPQHNVEEKRRLYEQIDRTGMEWVGWVWNRSGTVPNESILVQKLVSDDGIEPVMIDNLPDLDEPRPDPARRLKCLRRIGRKVAEERLPFKWPISNVLASA